MDFESIVMSKIYLKYANWNDTTSTWDWSSSISMNALKIIEKNISKRITGTTIRQIEYSSTLANKKKWSVVIGADILFNDSQYNNLISFWNGNRWKISLDNWVSEYEVVIPEGELPTEFIKNHKKLRKVTLEITQKDTL